MRGQDEFVYADFSGGVNLNAAPYLIADNQARDALNVNSNSNSQLRKRRGFTTHADLGTGVATFTAAPHSVAAAEVTAGDYILYAGTINGADSRFVAVSTAGTVTDLNGSTVPDADIRWSFAQAPLTTTGSQGPIFAMNGVNTPQFWDGNIANNFADWTQGTPPPTGRYVMYHANRLWCVTGDSRLRYTGFTGSSPDMGVWDANDFVDFHPADGQTITGLGTLGPYVLVFKEHKIFRVYDTVTGANSEITKGVGCHAQRSIVETDSGTFFLDDAGVYITDGEKVTEISDPVKPIILDAAEHASFANAAAVYHDNSYWLSLSTDGVANNRTLQYDLASESWWIHDCVSNGFATISTSEGEQIYSAAAGATRGQRAFVPETFQDSSANYAGGTFWVGPHFTWGMPHKTKRVTQVRADGLGEWQLGFAANYLDNFAYDSGEVWNSNAPDESILYAPDNDDNRIYAPSSSDGNIYAPAAETVTTRRYYTPGIGDACTFKIVNNDSADFSLFSYTTAINYRRD